MRTVPVPHGLDGCRTTGAVPVPYRGHFNHLDGRWTGRSRPVQDRHCTSVTAVQTGGRVSPNSLRLKIYDFYLNLIDLIIAQVVSRCPLSLHPIATVRFTSRNLYSTSRSTSRAALRLQCLSSSKHGRHPHFYWGWWSYIELDR